MKKLLSVIVCLILVIACFPLTAMADTTIEGDGETGISLTTIVPELSSITVTPPTKTDYYIGDELDTAGMVVTANYTDDSTKDVTSAATLSGFDSSTERDVTVTVSYTEDEKTVTATFTVTVIPRPELSSITVTPPTKTQYNVGEELDTWGMVVYANYIGESNKIVTKAVTLSGFDSSSVGIVTVTVSYTEGNITKTATFDVTIVEPVLIAYRISVSADPTEGGTVTGGGYYEQNASVTVTATANEHYSFVRWMEGSTEVSTSASYTFTATAHRTLVAVFEAEEMIHTVKVQPGEGTGTAFTVNSSTVISLAEMLAGSYDQTKGCFYLDDGEKVYYMLPSQCPFTAPEGKKFDCWECSFGGTFNGGASFDIEGRGNFTITALWNEEEESSVTLSIPATINVKYGDTQTSFDMQVKAATFNQENNELTIDLFNSSFTCASHDGTIPFTVTTNADEASEIAGGGYGFTIYSNTELPYTCQGFINITGNDWVAAKPGSYTATLSVRVIFN